VYLDDIIVFGNTIEEHNENLIKLLERLRKLGLKLQPDKCEYLRPELEYLGHLITKDGVKPNPAKINTVKNFKNPLNVTQVQSFLGLAGYYRKFIKNFSAIDKPLTQKETPFVWNKKCQDTFVKLINALSAMQQCLNSLIITRNLH
jgi:Reverse transcriptase (RNA-dependent DNA polymerase).